MPFPIISPRTSRYHSQNQKINPTMIRLQRDAHSYKPHKIHPRKRRLAAHAKKHSASRCTANAFHHPRNAGRIAPASPVKTTMNSNRTSTQPKPASKREESATVVYLKKDAIAKNHIAWSVTANAIIQELDARRTADARAARIEKKRRCLRLQNNK